MPATSSTITPPASLRSERGPASARNRVRLHLRNHCLTLSESPHPRKPAEAEKRPLAVATSKRPRQAHRARTETAETMRTQAAGSFHENYCFMGQFRKFMTIQSIFDATGRSCLCLFGTCKNQDGFSRRHFHEPQLPNIRFNLMILQVVSQLVTRCRAFAHAHRVACSRDCACSLAKSWISVSIISLIVAGAPVPFFLSRHSPRFVPSYPFDPENLPGPSYNSRDRIPMMVHRYYLCGLQVLLVLLCP
jgi:hypothetical protein